ncbi:protein FAM186B isoform X2 [Nannospalax galili]|uniref:protein FAM186B isoform X2 n=1 Tax=Nannospalax galili TaxID=1026970 RepID=UPI00111C04B7|nr:protein FAM186B isoform X2 [Nannospalax galili]
MTQSTPGRVATYESRKPGAHCTTYRQLNRLQSVISRWLCWLQLERNIHLNSPAVTVAKPRKCKSPQCCSREPALVAPPASNPAPFQHWESVPVRMAGQQGNQVEAIWKTDVASSSHPIEKKTPASLPWDQLGYPDIPRLLAVAPSHHRNLMSSRTRASVIQRKEFQEPSEEPAELVCKMSSQSLPGSVQSQKE